MIFMLKVVIASFDGWVDSFQF